LGAARPRRRRGAVTSACPAARAPAPGAAAAAAAAGAPGPRRRLAAHRPRARLRPADQGPLHRLRRLVGDRAPPRVPLRGAAPRRLPVGLLRSQPTALVLAGRRRVTAGGGGRAGERARSADHGWRNCTATSCAPRPLAT